MRTKKTALSERQKEVINLLAKGYTPSSVAQELYISESCAKLHMQTIYRKYGLHYEKGKDMKVRAIMKFLNIEELIKSREELEMLKGQYEALLGRYNKLLEEISFTD